MKIESLTTGKKIALVILGHALALVVALAVTKLYVFATGFIDRQASSGMTAFGDSFFFLVVFVVASLPAAGLGLFFLRAYRSFWIVLAALSVIVAITGLAALFALYVPYAAPRPTWFRMWELFAPLRALAAPLLFLVFSLSGLLSSSRGARLTLMTMAVSEAAVFAMTALRWFFTF